jgi:hypothetical protein
MHTMYTNAQTYSQLKLMWNKPCLGDAQLITMCFSVRDSITNAYSSQMCLRIE